MIRRPLRPLIWLALAAFSCFSLAGGPCEACRSGACDDLYFGRINGFPSDEITAVAADRKGNVFVGTEDKGLIIIAPDGKRWRQITQKKEGLSFDAIHDLWIGPDGTVWICTASGLNYLPPGPNPLISRKFFAEDGLADNVCLSVCQRENATELWVGTSRGLIKKAGGFIRYTDEHGLPANLIQCLGSDPQGTLWIGTSDGLAKGTFAGFEKVPLEQAVGVNDPWIYGMAWGTIQDQLFLTKLKTSYDAMLRGLGPRDRRLHADIAGPSPEELADEIKALQRKVAHLESDIPLFLATANGAFIKQLGSDRFELVRPGWFTAITSNLLGQGYAATTDLEVVPISFTESFLDNFSIATLIGDRLRAHLAAAAKAQPGDPAFASTTAVLEEMRAAGFNDPEDWIRAFLVNKRISDLTFSPLGQLWVAVKGGGLFRFRPIFANHDSGAYAIKFFYQFGFTPLENDSEGAPPPPPPPESPQAFGFKITCPQGDFPRVPQVESGIAIVRSIVPKAEKIWVGRWSELSVKECELVAEFVARWGHVLCIRNLAQTLAENPYVILPVGAIESSDPAAAPR